MSSPPPSTNEKPESPTSVDNSVESQSIPQSLPLSSNQLQNSAGGFSHTISDLNRLARFLCLGSEGGSYYVGERALTLDNARCLSRLCDEGRAAEALKLVVSVSEAGRAAKQTPTLLAYAYLCRWKGVGGDGGGKGVQGEAYAALGRVCRIPTHLFEFVGYCEVMDPDGGTGVVTYCSFACS